MSKAIFIDKLFQKKESNDDFFYQIIYNSPEGKLLIFQIDFRDFEENEEDQKLFEETLQIVEKLEKIKNQDNHDLFLPIKAIEKLEENGEILSIQIQCELPYTKTLAQYFNENDINEFEIKSNVQDFIEIYQFAKKENLDIKRDNMYLIEEKRKDKYPLLETNLGTYIYRSYQLSLIKHIKELNLKYAYFESRFIEFDTYLKVLKIYNKYLNDEINLDEAVNYISTLELNIEDGFTYKDSVYQKEEF
jgi:hypothetical protein